MAYDFDLFVIGGGSGGVRASRMAAIAGARVAIAEESHGNTKELYTQLAASFEHSARLIEEIKRSVP